MISFRSRTAKFLTVAFVFLALASSAFIVAKPAQAQDNTVEVQMQMLIQLIISLQAQIEALQNKSVVQTEVVDISANTISIGDTVLAADNLKVRSTPFVGNNVYGFVLKSHKGEVVDGPRFANGYRWWKVDYENNQGIGYVGWSAENWLQKLPIQNSNDEDLQYSLNIKHPDNLDQLHTGDTIQLSWDEKNLEGERGIVTLEGNGIQKHLLEQVDIGDEGVRVKLPDYQELGILTSKTYDLKLWVSYIKDGSPKGQSDMVRIKIIPKFSSDDDQSDDIECEISVDDDEVETGEIFEITWSTDVDNPTMVTPGKGEFGVRNSDTDTFSSGSPGVFTYSIGSSKEGILCSVEVEVIEEDDEEDHQKAVIEAMMEQLIEQLEVSTSKTSPTAEELAAQAENLSQQLDDIEKEKDYQKEIDDLMKQINAQEISGFWDLDWNGDGVYVVGVYEGSYPDGDRHSYGYHPQGEVVLTMNKQAGQMTDTMLVLTSYEPVKWQLEGDATEYVTRVFLSGYYDQEISGVDSDVEVIHMSHESGDDEYYYFYNKDSSEADKLIDYIESQSGYGAHPYYGSYSADVIYLGLKG